MRKEYYTYDPISLTFKRVPLLQRRLLFASVFISTIAITSFLTSFTKEMNFKPENLTEKEVILVLENENRFTPEKLKDALKKLNFVHQDIVFAQACLETGFFKSSIFRYQHNLFGMKSAAQRCTTNLGTERNHAVYNSWYDSVIDYAMYQSKYTSRFTREQYFQYLEKYYAEDPTYVKRLKQLIKKLNLQK
jgi:uncharacterized FlgJ-related protein